MTADSDSLPAGMVGPPRPPMAPATGLRRVKLAPHQMKAGVTPTEDLLVLAHLGVPRIDPAHWSLTIDGLVGRSVTLDLAGLTARPEEIVEAVHQCCGNPLEPSVPTRRVANVRWGGVDLAALLDEVQLDPQACFLWSYGLDGGDFAGMTCEWFVKDLPLARLAAGEVLLAYEVNGAPLPAEHGFPVRLWCRATMGPTASNGCGGCTSPTIGRRALSRPSSTMTARAPSRLRPGCRRSARSGQSRRN